MIGDAVSITGTSLITGLLKTTADIFKKRPNIMMASPQQRRRPSVADKVRSLLLLRNNKKKTLPVTTTLRAVLALLIIVIVFLYISVMFRSLDHNQQQQQQQQDIKVLRHERAGGRVSSKKTRGIKQQKMSSSSSSSCALRRYPPHRYYRLKDKEQPKFLKEDAMYIYGEWPILLQPSRKSTSPLSSSSAKLCVDQSEWLVPQNAHRKSSSSTTTPPPLVASTLPFADGTNPSIINIERLSKHSELYSLVRNELGGTYLATLCMTNSQCAWRDSEDDIRLYNLSRLESPVTVRTMLLVLNEQFHTLAQTTIYLHHDAPYSRLKPKTDTSKQRVLLALDDARLFLHHDRLWVSYREGKLFGYDKQVLNEIHITKKKPGTIATKRKGTERELEEEEKASSFEAVIKASETATLCCGRNMALMEHSMGKNDTLPQLQSLTWVDPITVVNVDDGRQRHGQPTGAVQQQQRRRRRLSRQKKEHHHDANKKKSSHIHGTNAFMVYLPLTNEYLGLGHFHRPSDRDPNPYARFGHHYTHTLFTISGSAPYRLQRLSPEFVLPASYHSGDDDAEIIQFVSGLEMAYHDPTLLVLAYGINDCEGAAMYVDLDYIHSLLRPVEMGKEVIDCMKPLPTGR